MSSVLYYSNYCNHCKELLLALSKTNLTNDIHFICIDKRIKKNGITYIQFENGQEIMLPSIIKKVPSLLLLNRGNIVVEGQEVNDYIFPKIKQEQNVATQMNGEPMAFGINDFGAFKNDEYSFLDQSADEMSAKGNGGMRQIHNYATLFQSDNIETPPDNYVPDKVKNMSLDELQAMRAKEVPQQMRRV